MVQNTNAHLAGCGVDPDPEVDGPAFGVRHSSLLSGAKNLLFAYVDKCIAQIADALFKCEGENKK